MDARQVEGLCTQVIRAERLSDDELCFSPSDNSSDEVTSKRKRESPRNVISPDVSSWEGDPDTPLQGHRQSLPTTDIPTPIGSLSPSDPNGQSPLSIVRKNEGFSSDSPTSIASEISAGSRSDSLSDCHSPTQLDSDAEQVAAKDDAVNEIMVVVAGKSGAGKSTLINNLLERNEDIEITPDSTTEKLENQTIRIEKEGVAISIIDTPGLKEEREEKIKQLRELFDFTKGKADLLVYCIPVGPGFKFNDANPTIMKSLQRVFGKKVWRHCVVVFTFSNQAWEKISASNNNQEVETIAKYKDYIRKYTERFQEMLVKLKVTDVAVRSIFDLPPHPRNKEEGFTIVTVPAGKSLEDRVLADKDVDYENWRSAVFLEMISGCKDNKKKPFLECWYGRKRVKETLENIKQVALGSSGAGVMVVSGTVIGATAGLGGGPLGMLIGGTLGAAAGIVASIVMGGGIVAHQT